MTYHEAVRTFKRGYWVEMLRVHGDVRTAAKVAGVYRTYLHKLLVQLEVRTHTRHRSAHRGDWGSMPACRYFRAGRQAARETMAAYHR